MSLFTPVQRRDGEFFTSDNQLIPTRAPFSTGGQPVTSSTALTKVPLLAATNLVANMGEILPLQNFQTQTGTPVETVLPAVLRDPEGNGYGMADFLYKFLTLLILRGNAFLRVEAVDQRGKPSVVTLLSTDDVVVRRDEAGRWVFAVGGQNAKPFAVQGPGGIIHRRSYPRPGSVLGLSVIANHARMLGLSIAAEQFGADFFGDGAHPSAVLTSDQPISQEQATTIKQRVLAALRGNREPAVLGAGMKWQQVQINPDESQFLETQKFTAAEQCRMVGPGVAEMLGYETGGAMTYQNVQSRSLHLLIYAINPWIRRAEQMFSDVFVPQPQTVKFNRDALLQMTAGDRWTVFGQMLKPGALTINEVRAQDGRPPVEWGDKPFLPAFGPAAAAAELINDPTAAKDDQP